MDISRALRVAMLSVHRPQLIEALKQLPEADLTDALGHLLVNISTDELSKALKARDRGDVAVGLGREFSLGARAAWQDIDRENTSRGLRLLTEFVKDNYPDIEWVYDRDRHYWMLKFKGGKNPRRVIHFRFSRYSRYDGSFSDALLAQDKWRISATFTVKSNGKCINSLSYFWKENMEWRNTDHGIRRFMRENYWVKGEVGPLAEREIKARYRDWQASFHGPKEPDLTFHRRSARG